MILSIHNSVPLQVDCCVSREAESVEAESVGGCVLMEENRSVMTVYISLTLTCRLSCLIIPQEAVSERPLNRCNYTSCPT